MDDILKVILCTEGIALPFSIRWFGTQLFPQVNQLPVQVIDGSPVLMDTEAAQNLSVLYDRIMIGYCIHIPAIPGGIMLPMVQLGLSGTNDLRNIHIRSIPHGIYHGYIFTKYILCLDGFHLNQRIIQQENPAFRIAEQHGITHLIDHMHQHIMPCILGCITEDKQLCSFRQAGYFR